jgi:hypothetical protein
VQPVTLIIMVCCFAPAEEGPSDRRQAAAADVDG